jgi:predicted nuclease of predicted toxin-antitoxin system
MKILIDMNLSFRWADMLMDRGIEAVYWHTLGPGNTPDTEIMSYARANGYTVLTRDLDFGDMLAAANRLEPSVVQIRIRDIRPEVLIERVTDTLISLAAQIEHGAIVTIDEHKTRVHILPLTKNIEG